MKKIKKIYLVLTVIALFVLTAGGLTYADESIIKIAEDGNYAYFKPEVKISPSGDIYIAYQAQNLASGRSEIHLSKYSTSGKVSLVKNLSDSGAYFYEPEIDIAANGAIHAAWADQRGDSHIIKYRYYNGSSWSDVMTFGQVDNTENIEDLRIAVDPAGNVFVVFMHWPAAKCKFISKYGNDITFESFPMSGRSKHPDVDADNGYVHIVWQYKGGDEYTIAYQRRPNSRNSAWQNWVDLEFYGTQRPRMCLDSSNIPHVVFFQNFGSTRILWYKKWNGSKFHDLKRMSDPNNAETYHFCDISAANGDNMLVTMQRGGWSGGKNVCYNWKQNGKWSGFSSFSKSYGLSPTKQSIDLAGDRFFAAGAFCEKDDAVYLLVVQEDGSPGPGGDAPVARFTYSPQGGHAPLDVTFDATESSDPDGEVVYYNWDFGDGSTGSGHTLVHRFALPGEYTVRLTVTDDDGKTASTSHLVVVEEANQPPVASFTFSPLKGLYPLTVTFDASASHDPDGQVAQYEWDFGGEQTASGPIVTHTFTEEGLQQIILTVYDDDGDSATASGTVEVLGLLPPLNIAYEALINRNLFTIQHVYRITWNSNPGNSERGADIVQYNIYRRPPSDGGYDFVATIASANEAEYYDRIGNVKEDYIYTVTSVDNQGRESSLTTMARQGASSLSPPEDLKEKKDW
jgi:chitodextrinase